MIKLLQLKDNIPEMFRNYLMNPNVTDIQINSNKCPACGIVIIIFEIFVPRQDEIRTCKFPEPNHSELMYSPRPKVFAV